MALQDDLLSSLPRQLSSDQALSCEGQMMLDEMTSALKKMNSNKAPGPDSLSVELCQILGSARSVLVPCP